MTKRIPQREKWVERFEKSVRGWQRKLGLTDWCFFYRPKAGDGSISATVDTSCSGRNAVFSAHRESHQDDMPERIGLHETLHVLFADMLKVAAMRGDRGHPDVALAEHIVIERLVNFIDGVP